MEKLYYKGRGEHSVRQLELIIEQLEEELHLFKSGQNKFENNFKRHDIITDGVFKAKVISDSETINKTHVVYLHNGCFEYVNSNECELLK